MLKKIKYTFYIVSFFLFIILITNFYFSDQNIIDTNKSRSSYSVRINNDKMNIPLLKNDTNNIIEYRDDIEIYKKKKKKYKFWELIDSK
jgi:hypothetical protein|tara:strand:+ start:261 stop:527 length:267 start_codon:yes stop_codon:yes gene_type:complete